MKKKKGIVCPGCGGQLRAYRTSHRENDVRHYKQCVVCGSRHYTTEVYGACVNERANSRPCQQQYTVNGNAGHWPIVKEALRLQMGQATYDVVVGPMNLMHWHDGLVIVKTTELSRDWVKGKRSLNETICRAFNAIEPVNEIIFKV